ncbi:MAG: ATP-binding cassette domain-containing protein [Treponema sp.]|nr:ATP-binding cassette domain-containing protein [Treponema sp.]
MRDGKIVEDGPSEKVFSAPGHAYTAQLVNAVAREKNIIRDFSNTKKFEPFVSTRALSNSYVSRSFGLFGKLEEKRVLKDIDLDIGKGEIFGLCGESGGGKSTLARCILGLIPYRGEIIFSGMDVSAERARGFFAQMIFQEPGASLNPMRKIGWLLEEPLIVHRRALGLALSAGERERKVDEMLALVGLESAHKSRRARELSGGQKQRACIARALMLKPKMLIADEATSALDVFSGAQILDLFRSLRESLGLTILFISHDREATEDLCDRVARMREGRLEI